MAERVLWVREHNIILIDPTGPFRLLEGAEARRAKLEQLNSRIKADLAHHAASMENDASKPNS